MTGIVFEWDGDKAKTNVLKHHVSFEEATTVFGDSRSLTIHNPLRLIDEKRFATIGLSAKMRILVVIHTEGKGK